MNNIGERIKLLRKKNDMTQEKLADYLGVTYQSVSKWECGINTPDISFIGPLTKLLNVSADELLGLTVENTDERRAYFDGEYFEYWKKDHKADLEIARQAVKEYPNDFRYLEWLASDEWYVGYGVEYMGTDTEKELLKSSEKHFLQIIEDCKDNDLRYSAMRGIIHVYTAQNQYDKARKIAQMFPEESTPTRDEVLSTVLKGEELTVLRRKMVRKNLQELINVLSSLWNTASCCSGHIPVCKEALEAEEAVIKAIITDENYLQFHLSLYFICFERAKYAMESGNCDLAMEHLRTAIFHAEKYDEFDKENYGEYTSPILLGYAEDYRGCRKEGQTIKAWLTDTVRQMNEFRPLWERDDFKELFGR